MSHTKRVSHIKRGSHIRGVSHTWGASEEIFQPYFSSQSILKPNIVQTAEKLAKIGTV